MKAILKIFFLVSIFFLTPQHTEAQFFKKLKKHAEKKIEREAEKRSEKRVDKKIDKEFDKAEDAIDGKNKDQGEKSDKQKKEADQTSKQENTNADGTIQSAKQPTVVWSKFDFVPGDTVIYEDLPSTDEENGEFPSRWDLHEGSAEIGELNGESVIMFLTRGSIVPYLKNSKEDYLPEVFTIEMDVWFGKSSSTGNRFWIYLGDRKNNRSEKGYKTSLGVYPHSLECLDSGKKYPGTENTGWHVEKNDVWHHISIAYTKGKFKAYMGDTRLINIPHLEVNPSGITIEAGKAGIYVKNIRIAKGGVKYYDRVLSEGKIIVNGIKFDVNKATLKAESMGPINKIYKLMVDNPTVNFSVEGHTDADGGDDTNMTLSKGRGKTVMDKLISMGIAPIRLKSNGFGESKPIDNNSTPEGKANNRRVEFVKF